ncbi:MAG: hypothetical protein V3T84_14525 [Phycisphaerales bacterium]
MGEYWIEPPPIVAPPIASQEPGTIAVALDQDGRLAEDVACRHCGYNLRGLALDGQCPECEMAIEKTLHAFLLRFCDPVWLGRLRSGLTLLIVAIFAGLTVEFIFRVSFILLVGATGEPPLPLVLVFLLLFAGIGCMQLIAYWRITSPEPNPLHEESPLSARRIAKVGLILSAASGLLGLALDPETYIMATMEVADAPIQAGFAWTLGLVGAGSALIGLFALFIYARSIALRFPADNLAKSTRLVMWGYTIPAAAAAIVQLVAEAYFSTSTSFGGFEIARMVGQVVLGIPMLGFGIWGIFLLFMYRHRLKQALALAKADSTDQDSTN